MAFPKVQESRELSEDELQAQILSIKKELFQLRMKRATSQPTKPSEFRFAKHRLSQLLTVERERQSQA